MWGALPSSLGLRGEAGYGVMPGFPRSADRETLAQGDLEMRTSAALLTLLGVAGLPAGTAMGQTVTLNGFDASRLETRADDQFGGSASDSLFPATLPYSNTSSSIDGGASSIAQYDLSNDGFVISHDQSRVSTAGSSADYFTNIFFSVDQDTTYVVSGSYCVADPDGRQVTLRGQLIDHTLASTVFDSHQTSNSTPNETLTLGESGGDFSNTNIGSLSGTLIAGHEYEFHNNALIVARDVPSSTGATASGAVSFMLGGADGAIAHCGALPELPALGTAARSVLIGLLCVLTVWQARRRAVVGV